MLDGLRTRLSASRSPTYVCEGCALTYERAHANCPACGFAVVEAT